MVVVLSEAKNLNVSFKHKHSWRTDFMLRSFVAKSAPQDDNEWWRWNSLRLRRGVLLPEHFLFDNLREDVADQGVALLNARCIV